MSEPFLSPEIVRNKLCLLCDKDCKKRDRVNYPTAQGWEAFQTKSKSWSEIDIPLDDIFYHYGTLHETIKDFTQQEKEEYFKSGKCVAHETCRVNFNNRLKRYTERFSQKIECPVVLEVPLENDDEKTFENREPSTRARRSHKIKHLCFICNERRESDASTYDEGGLLRCERDGAKNTLFTCQEYHLTNSTVYAQAAERLKILLSGTAYDVFAEDVYYHHSCYRKFTRLKSVKEIQEDTEAQSRSDVLESFMFKLRIKVIRDKFAYLLHELLNDVKLLSEEHGLSQPLFGDTYTLKRKIIERFPNEIDFFPQGKFRIVHASDINPCKYAVNVLQGCGLRDRDIIRSFAALVKKLMNTKVFPNPKTPKDFETALKMGPHPALYNAIYLSMFETSGGRENEDGYIETYSNSIASKIWSTALDWESLITGIPAAKQVVLGTTILRMTGSKKTIRLLSKSNHVASYKEIQKHNVNWANLNGKRISLFSNMRKGITTHSTVDNNDGRQETLTGAGTTHDTNQTLFQVPSIKERKEIPTIESQDETTLNMQGLIDDIDMFNTDGITPFHIGDKVDPQLFKPIADDENCQSELEYCRKKDILWALAGSVSGVIGCEELPKLGSWTAFNRVVSKENCLPCVQEFLPVSPHPPKYPICKKYLDFLLDVIDDLEIPFIFVHSDEDIYSKLCALLWRDPELYKRIILLMGGFHQLRLRQKLMYKRFLCLGLKEWCIDAKTIAPGSAEQAWEGRHYYRSMRCHKECFDALVRTRIDKITKNHTETDPELLTALVELRKNPSPDAADKILSLEPFDNIVKSVLAFEEGTVSHFTVEYIKDTSSMLAMVSAVREGNLERHLQSEREMLKQTFAFDHYNYARYCSYQHVYLRSLESSNHPAIMDLKKNGFGASITGEAFSAIHGDLVTELFNKETKSASGPFRRGFSTSSRSVNVWVRTIHIQSRLFRSYMNSVHDKTNSTHKELTLGGKELHEKHVQDLKLVLPNYGIDPFSNDVPRCFATGEELAEDIASDVLAAPSIGNKLYKKFITERLYGRKKSLFDKIPKNKLKYVKKKKKKTIKEKTVLQEDRIAFGYIISKSIDPKTAFAYPITSLPLAIAEPDGTLRASCKATLRNYLIDECCAEVRKVPNNCDWIVDGMAAIRSVVPRQTYRQYIKALINYMSPPSELQPELLTMVNDTYLAESTKDSTRSHRGESEVDVLVEGLDQHMPTGNKWTEFLCNGNNKTSLIKLISSSIGKDDIKSLIRMPFVFTREEKMFELRSGEISEIGTCNQEEADTRLVLHALLSPNDVVIVCQDTDVLILMIWAYSKFQIKRKWFMKYQDGKYANIKDIVEYLGDDISQCLPHLHAITGCDQASAFYRRGKVKVLKKVMDNPELLLLIKELGVKKSLDQKVIDNCFEFVRTVIYKGKAKEDYISTRLRLYKTSKTKSTVSIPPDPDSLLQAMKRVHIIVYEWIRSHHEQIEHLQYRDFGWKWCEEKKRVCPVWFVGPQLPPSAKQKPKSTDENPDDADDECEGRRSSRRKKSKVISKNDSKKQKLDALKLSDENPDDADGEYESGRSGRRKKSEVMSIHSSKKQKLDAPSSFEQESDDEEDDGDDEISHSDPSSGNGEHVNEGRTENEEDELYLSSDESDWEVSDFNSTSESEDEWKP